MKKILGLIMLTVLFILCLVGCGKKQGIENPENQVETRPIQSCVLNSEIQNTAHGSFVLGIANYTESSSLSTSYYVYVKGTEGYRLQRLYFDNVEIVETDEVEPCIKGYFKSNGKVYKSVYDIDGYYHENDELYEPMTQYILYVPTNTIRQEYSVDILESLE